MANLRKLEPTPGPGIVTYPGIVVASPTNTKGFAVNVNGNILPARWADPLVVAIGDPVLVSISTGPGQGEAFVMSRLTGTARPSAGTVKTVPGGTTITVTGSDGTDYTATYVTSYTPTVADPVILSWNAAQPTVLGKAPAAATTAGTGAAGPTPVSSPPPAPQTGQSTYAATDSATWVPGLGAWDAWAGGGGNVFQGTSGSSTTYGAWFYSNSPSELSGRTVTRIQFRTGARRSTGNDGAPVVFHFYAHTSPTRPSGDVGRTTGPFDVTIQPGQGPTTIDLPTSFGSAITGGGGISITGEPYAGMNGRYVQPDSGALTLDWTR